MSKKGEENKKPNEGPEGETEEARKKREALDRLRGKYGPGAGEPTLITTNGDPNVSNPPGPQASQSLQPGTVIQGATPVVYQQLPVTQGQPPIPMQYQAAMQSGQQFIYVPVPTGQTPAQPNASPPAQIEAQAGPAPVSKPEEEVIEPPLYKQFIERPPAEWLVKDFDDRYQKGGYTYNPFLLGAVEAIATILKYKKYEAHEEMMLDFIGKYNKLLEDREDVVRLTEAKYKQKHDLFTEKEREQMLKKRLKELNP